MPAINLRPDDHSWSVLLPGQFQVFPPCRVRHDPGFDWQVYLQSCIPDAQNSVLVTIAQAVASDNRKSVTTRVIFGKPISGQQNFTQSCIDEVAHKLYLFYQGIPAEKWFHLTSVGISFGLPDKFGHRRVTARQGGGISYKINFGDLVMTDPNFFLHPTTGEVLFQFYDQFEMDSQLNGKLDMNSVHGSVVNAKILTGKTTANIYGYRFTQNGNQLAVFRSPTVHQDKHSIIHLYSIDGQFRLERELFFDHFTMLRKFCPSLMATLKFLRLNFVIKFLSDATVFCGHSFKYTMVTSVSGVFAVKRFDRWVTDGLGQKTRHVLMEHDGLWKAIRVNPDVIKKFFVMGSMVYFPGIDDKREYLHRLELGDEYKDYRTCAHCGEKETGKRRNAEGKRIAQFKVCGECKKLNLHYKWWEFPCHFCSQECVKKGWKEHKKQQHEPHYVQHPFMWMLVAVVMILLLKLLM